MSVSRTDRVVGDSGQAIFFDVSGASDLDLANSTFTLRVLRQDRTYFDRTGADLVLGLDLQVRYEWKPGDLTVEGVYVAQLRIVGSGGNPVTHTFVQNVTVGKSLFDA